ncbi:hypothetical protein D9M71_307760 [compost metagenome]
MQVLHITQQLLTEKKPHALPRQIDTGQPRAGLYVDERLMHLHLPGRQLLGTDRSASESLDFPDAGIHQVITGNAALVDQLQGERLIVRQGSRSTPEPCAVDIEAVLAKLTTAEDLRAGQRVLPIGQGLAAQQDKQPQTMAQG